MVEVFSFLLETGVRIIEFPHQYYFMPLCKIGNLLLKNITHVFSLGGQLIRNTTTTVLLLFVPLLLLTRMVSTVLPKVFIWISEQV